MLYRSPSICRSWVLVAALLVATGGAASVCRSQQVVGSIGVSLTILRPTASLSFRVTSFSVDRNGIARLETAVATSAATSQLVMTRVSNSTNGFASEPQAPALLLLSTTESRLRTLVHVGRAPPAAHAPPVEVRVEYLTVAGT